MITLDDPKLTSNFQTAHLSCQKLRTKISALSSSMVFAFTSWTPPGAAAAFALALAFDFAARLLAAAGAGCPAKKGT